MPRRRSSSRPRRPRLRETAGFTEAPDRTRVCACEGCSEEGLYRAPVAPDCLESYYWFCLDHVREYNRAWNFCAGRSDAEIEALIREDTVGWRPTWPLGELGGRFTRVHLDRIRDAFGLFEDEREAERRARAGFSEGGCRHRRWPSDPEKRALDVLELEPPVTEEALKARYKELVKRHHPDANGGDKVAEERLKLINEAYATLRSSLGA